MRGGWKRRAYRDGRPRGVMRALNRVDALLYRVLPRRMTRGVVLCVTGRRSGRPRRIPLALVVHRGERHLVSMLGQRAGWVHDVRAADGCAVLQGRRTEAVRLEELPVDERAPLLRAHLRIAPGARAHVPVDPSASLDELAQIADRYPVFRVVPR